MSNETEPHLNLNARHNQSIHQQGSESTDNIPEPLYRLRVSVLKDGEGSKDCPIRMFVRYSRQPDFCNFELTEHPSNIDVPYV